MATNTKNINRAAILWLIFVFPIGLLIMWLRTDWSKTVKWAITSFFVLITIVAIANSSSNSNNQQQQTTTQSSVSSAPSTPSNSPEPTAAPTVTPKPTLTPQQIIAIFESQAQTVTVANIYKSPTSCMGRRIPLSFK